MNENRFCWINIHFVKIQVVNFMNLPIYFLTIFNFLNSTIKYWLASFASKIVPFQHLKDICHHLRYFPITCTLCLICFHSTTLAQQTQSRLKPLRGMVMSVEDDELLVGVHIYAKIAHVGKVSDQNGIFEMLVHENDTIIVTFVGYERQLIPMAYFRENSIDLVIRMDSEIIVLPGITIIGEVNIDYLKRPERSVIRIPGLPAPAEKPDVGVPVGSLNYGPLSRWGKEAKEKRKLMEVYTEAQKERIYIQTVSSDSVRTIFMHQYDLNENEYNDFVIFFNTYKPFMDRQDPKDIVRVMHQTFMRYRPGRE